MLSRRSEDRKKGGKKAGVNAAGREHGCGDAVKEANAAWAIKTEEFMRREIEEVHQREGESREAFRERQARSYLPEEKQWKHICCTCGKPTHDPETARRALNEKHLYSQSGMTCSCQGKDMCQAIGRCWELD